MEIKKMIKSEFIRNFINSAENTIFRNSFIFTKEYDKQGRLFKWEYSENETYACVDWNADNMPIFTLQEMDKMEVLDYKVDRQADCLILYLDI